MFKLDPSPGKGLTQKRFYLTKDGLAKIEEEYQHLKAIKQHKMQGDVPKLLHSDELDPEYLTLYEDVSLLETKIADLASVLKNAELIKPPPKKERHTIQLGAMVKLAINGHLDEFEIVGTLEANPALGKLSNESPVGKALLGRAAGDDVILSSPIKTHYKIRKVAYRDL